LDALLIVYLSLRKFFGFLLPGFLWLVVLGWLFPGPRAAGLSELKDLLPGSVARYAFAIVLAYAAGSVLTVISFRILELFEDWLGPRMAHVRDPYLRRLREWLSRRFFILDAGTAREELEAEDQAIREKQPTEPEPPVGKWEWYGLYLRQHAPALALEDREIEAEINFVAGLFLPALFAGIVLLVHHSDWGFAALGLALLLALRFQHLKHYEGAFLAKAYWIARSSQISHGQEKGNMHA